MLALQRRKSGSESSCEKEGDDTLWDGMQLLEDAYTSGSIGNFQKIVNKSTAKGVAIGRNEEPAPINPDEAPSGTSQNHQQQPALHQPVTTPKYASQDILSYHTEPSGSLRNGQQETIHQPGLASFDSTGTAPHEESTHTHTKAQKQGGEGYRSIGGQAEHLSNPKQGQARSDSFNGSVVHSFATASLRSFRRRKPQPWPNPQKSLGEMIETGNKKIKGKVWVAEGPALELFEAQIRPQIEKLLHNTEPPQCSPLLLSLYMIGKAEVSATPTVMICCCDRKVRKDAEISIRESDILQQFPQIGLGNSATLLETNSFVVPVTGRSTNFQRDAPSASIFEEEHVIGRRVRLIDKAGGGKTVRFATGGPFIGIGKYIYQLTAFHYGQKDADTDPGAQLDSDPDDFEYDGQSDTEEDEYSIKKEHAEETQLKKSFNTSLENESMSLSMEYHRDVVLEEDGPQGPWNPRALINRRNVDYDLVRLPAAEASRASNSTGSSKNHHSFQVTDIDGLPVPCTRVVVVASYGILTGAMLSGTKRVKMHGYYGFQDLFPARLSCSVKTGDSGSAVLDASTGCFYGHIVLGSAPDTLVYIVPSIDIFTNILASFGKLPTLNLESSVLNERTPREVAYQKGHPMDASIDPSEPDPISLNTTLIIG